MHLTCRLHGVRSGLPRLRCGAGVRSRQSGIAHGSPFRQQAVSSQSTSAQAIGCGRSQTAVLVRIGLTRDTPPLSRAARQPPRSTTLLPAVVAALRLMSVGLDGWRRAAGGAREDEADRRPPPWFRLLRRIPQRGRARHAVLTYARRPLRLREGRLGHHPPHEAAKPTNTDEQN
jgi:hypothetical protein